jgi:hypothetical protein
MTIVKLYDYEGNCRYVLGVLWLHLLREIEENFEIAVRLAIFENDFRLGILWTPI